MFRKVVFFINEFVDIFAILLCTLYDREKYDHIATLFENPILSKQNQVGTEAGNWIIPTIKGYGNWGGPWS